MTRPALVLACGLLACQSRPESASGTALGASGPEPAAGGMTLESDAFPPGGEIPRMYTCEGEDRSPPLRWSGVPAEAKSLALVVIDPDVPDPAAPTRTWVHWILVDLPPVDGSLPAGVTVDHLPPGTREGTNDFKRIRYGGPCPPIGRHRYIHILYALDTTFPSLSAPTRAELEQAITGHVVDRAELVGTYEKQDRAGRE